ncbi:translation initiation factor IF-2-like [Zalophus californianus]|uniref:Translation initiation factor IF-2-like n=1 Tax=Zalophus californianus TaxID=9704 RepID=A0A6J2DVY0_ZALCA|nr:translation initiation factor IF-2-like [Zalophus californianus]
MAALPVLHPARGGAPAARAPGKAPGCRERTELQAEQARGASVRRLLQCPPRGALVPPGGGGRDPRGASEAPKPRGAPAQAAPPPQCRPAPRAPPRPPHGRLIPASAPPQPGTRSLPRGFRSRQLARTSLYTQPEHGPARLRGPLARPPSATNEIIQRPPGGRLSTRLGGRRARISSCSAAPAATTRRRPSHSAAMFARSAARAASAPGRLGLRDPAGTRAELRLSRAEQTLGEASPKRLRHVCPRLGELGFQTERKPWPEAMPVTRPLALASFAAYAPSRPPPPPPHSLACTLIPTLCSFGGRGAG